MKTPKRPVGLMTLAQGICLLAIPLTFALALLTCETRSYAVFVRNNLIIFALMLVELEAFCICGRVKKASTFSAKNEKALGRIVAYLSTAGCISLLFGDSIMPWLLTGLPAISPVVEWLLLPFILLTLALMIRAVQVLMRRALDMQEESDLTV